MEAKALKHQPQPKTEENLEEIFKQVMKLMYRDYPLSGNQMLDLSARIQRAGIHHIIEERSNRQPSSKK